MVAVRYCDHCGHRLPIDYDDGDTYLCPECGKPVQPEPSPPQPSSATRKTKIRLTPPPARASGRRPALPTRGSKRKTPARGQSKRLHTDPSQSGRSAVSNSNTMIIVLAALGAMMLTVAVMLIVRRGKGKAETGSGSTVVSPLPVVATPPVAGLGGAAQSDPTRGGSALFGGGEDKQDVDDDFFANLRKQSESRRQNQQVELDRRMEAFLAVLGPEWKPAGEVAGWMLNDCPMNHFGRSNTISTHPYSEDTPFAFERTAAIADRGMTALVVTVAPRAADSVADWMLVVKVDGYEIASERVGSVTGQPRWQTFRFDLGRYAGRTVKLRIENAAGGRNGWATEHGHWAEARIVTR